MFLRALVPGLALVVVMAVVGGCKVPDPLYCDTNTPCTDPDRPFCDLTGQYPASDGIGRTCIPDPTAGGDAGPGQVADAGDGGGGTPDAAGPRRVVQLAVGEGHTCAVLSDGALRCWGYGPALGYASTEDIGDNEKPYEAGDVPTGGPIKQVATGYHFTCALYRTGKVRCWGRNNQGQLGYGDTLDRSGAGSTPDLLPDIELNGTAVQIDAGYADACAILESGDVRCWGDNGAWQLSTGDQNDIGDNELPGSRSPLPFGGRVTRVRIGRTHLCAVMAAGTVRCSGWPTYGPLGYPDHPIVGDDETPAQAGDINVGGQVQAIATGGYDTCALLTNGHVRCWGNGDKTDTAITGVLGYKETQDIVVPPGDLSIGGNVTAIASMRRARCALLDTGAVRCWGEALQGSLGYGNLNDIGDNEFPLAAGDVPLGGPVAGLALGQQGWHMCALMQSGDVRCWGKNDHGQLGLGTTTNSVGDNEKPSSVPPVQVLVP